MREVVRGALGWRAWSRRTAFVARVRLAARLAGSTVEVDVADDVRVGDDVKVWVAPGTRNRLRIGPGSILGDRVYLELRGGDVDLGPRTDLRRDVVLNVSGRLRFAGGNILSYSCAVHCAEEVALGELTSASELVVIADSRHHFTDPDTHFYDNVVTAPVRIGRNVWLASKATVASGATIGDCSLVAAHAVVTGEVPERTMVAGAPARSVRETLPA